MYFTHFCSIKEPAWNSYTSSLWNFRTMTTLRNWHHLILWSPVFKNMVTVFSSFCSLSLFWQVLLPFIKEHILSAHFVVIMGIFKLIKFYHYSLAEVSDWCSIPWIFLLIVCIRHWIKFENSSCCLKCGILKDQSSYTFNWLKLNLFALL